MPGRRTRFLPVSLLALTLAVSGCTPSPSAERTPESAAPASTPVEALDEITKSRIYYYDGHDADPEQNWADFYLPAGPQARDSIPLVVLVHGGGWRAPIGADVFDRVAMDLAGRGMAVYNVEYRRLNEGGGWPNTFHDVARALDHIVEVDEAYPQITTDDELVVGHSAGGQLATWAGTRHKLDDDEVGSHPKFRPTRVVSLAGPLDMRQTAADGNDHIVPAMGGSPEQFPQRWDAVDPIKNLDAAIPVAAVHGTRDTVVRPHNSINYTRALNDAGGNGRLVLLDDQDHLSLVRPGDDAYRQVLDLITEYARNPVDELATG